MPDRPPVSPAEELETLRRELAEAREALDAIRSGEVDALVVSSPGGDRVFTLEGADFAYRALVEQMAEGAATLNRDGIVLFANESLSRMAGQPLDGLVGKPFTRFLLEKSRELFEKVLDESVRTGFQVRAVVDIDSGTGASLPATVAIHALDIGGSPTISVTVADLTEHVALARASAVREAEKHLRAFYDSPLIGVIYWNIRGTITDANDKFLETMGCSRADLDAGRINWLEMTPPEFHRLDEASLEELRSTGVNARPFEKEYIRGDGTRVPVLIAGAMLDQSRENGVAFVLDITERKKAERALRESQQKYQALIETTSDFIWEIDAQGRYTYCSPQMETLWGFRPADMIGKTPADVVPAQMREAVAGTIADLTKSPRPFIGLETTARDVQGRRIDAEVSGVPFYGADGALLGFRGITRDVTARRKTGEAQRESEARFRLLAWTADRLLAEADPQAFIEQLCREVMTHLGCDVCFNFLADEEAGRLHLNACAGVSDDVVREMEWLDYGWAVCGRVARDRKRIVAEDIQHSEDSLPALVRGFGVQAYCCHPIMAQGKLLGTLSFGTRERPHFTESEIDLMRIVTDQVAAAMQRVLAEKALREAGASLEQRVAERTSEVEALVVRLRELALELSEAELRERRRVARILHDHFQQLLVAAKLQVGVLRSKVRADILRSAAHEADDLLTEAIRSSRTLAVELSPPVLHEGGLVAGLDWLRQRMKEQHGLDVRVTADADVDPGSDDLRSFAFEAVRELLFNVVKHSGARQATLAVRRRDGEIEVRVEDAGPGLRQPRDMAKGGAEGGFGLFSIGQRLELLGGSMVVGKPDGSGIRVDLVIPLTKSAAGPGTGTAAPPRQGKKRGKPAAPGKPPAERIRVVLADDHRIVRQGFVALLGTDEEIEVVGQAADGTEALELVQSLRPDVVVMDVSMPKMSGVEATRWITANMPDVRVIGLSMHDEEQTSTAMREAGAVAYVTKDGPSAALVAAIHAARPAESRGNGAK